MASTAIPAAEDAIVEILEEAEGLSGVVVTAEKEPERAPEYIWLYKAESERDFRLIGDEPAPLDEDLTFSLRILVIKGKAKELAPAKSRAFEILEETEAALREDLKLKQTVRMHRIASVIGEQVSFDERRGFHILFTIEAKARI